MYTDLLRSDSVNLEIGDVLRASPDVLLGLGPGAAHGLTGLDIDTVFDLARSSTFAAATLVLDAARDPSTPESRLGALPSDVLASSAQTSMADAGGLPVASLRAFARADADGALAETLDVRTVRDLALWPPYLAARSILDEATQASAPASDDTPGDLLPMSGRYPTERAYYSSYILADVDDPAGEDRTALEDAGPLDPLPAVTAPGFTRPVRGARLTFAQSWYSQGVALGQLLHSLALAPGESTRLAMIDWSRQQSGTESQQAGQTEQLIGDTTQKRAMSEVQGAVSREAQNGFSNTSTSSTQMQGGVSTGFSLGPVTLGGSFSGSKASASSATVTGSSGVRSVSAAMTQNVADATHQAASSARNMFASVVRELSQSEHEAMSTRVVANYNHMHAITVQYYEVVQVYRTVIGLHRFEPCLYVPMKLVDFTGITTGGVSAGDAVVRRYRAALQAAALDAHTAALLAPDTLGVVEIQPSTQAYETVSRGVTTDANGNRVPVIDRVPMTGVTAPPLSAEVALRLAGQLDGLRRQLGRDVVTRSGDTFEAPDDLVLNGASASFPALGLQLQYADGSAPTPISAQVPAPTTGDPFQVSLEPVPLSQLAALELEIGPGVSSAVGVLTLNVSYQGLPLDIPLPVALGSDATFMTAATFTRQVAAKALLQHLQDQQLYYSQVVWQAMDSATVALLLGAYTYRSQPLAQTVDPSPIGVTGNYLIFRMPWEARDLLDPGPSASPGIGSVQQDSEWVDWITRHADYATTQEDLVPLPSGGVFAEAVLGRSNSAEKLDITRFWNWQDSPIPLQPPDIAALQSGSRAQADDTTATGLAAPVVAFNNPPAIPDPTGLGAALGAVANGAMFRDMSGAAVTQALAAAALASAGQGATSAGAQAAASAAAAAQKEIEMAKLAVSALTGGAAGGADSKTVSEHGAKINEGKSMDDRGVAGADATGDGAAGSHEAQAAEGSTGKVLDMLKGAMDTSPAEPSGSASSSTPETEA